MTLPPGINSRTFSLAVREFERIVGKQWVFSSEEDLSLYRDAYSPLWNEKGEPIPPVAIAPADVEQVRAVVKAANSFRIPLWTISTGKNLGYGGSAPAAPGTGVLDLKRMNRILEVDDKNHYALVEPGVSYFDLHRYIQENKLKVWIDPPDPGWGSPVGNTLDRGLGRTRMRDHVANMCGMEVVLANGDLVRTGMGALPNAKTWQQFKYGYGPYVDGIFTQSNYGVVTKLGFWLYPEPEAYLVGRVRVPKRDDVTPLVDMLSYLANSEVAQGPLYLSSPLYAPGPPDPALAAIRSKPGGGTVADLEAYAQQKGGFWSTDLPIYGAREVVAAKWQVAQRKLLEIPGAIVEKIRSYEFPLSAAELAKMENPVEIGVPSLTIFTATWAATMGKGHLFIAPVIPMNGPAVIESMDVIRGSMEEIGFRDYAMVPAATLHERCFIILVIFATFKEPERNQKVREALRRMARVTAEHGWGEYRAHTAFMSDIADSYSFNNHALRRLHETIKDALDLLHCERVELNDF